MARGPDDAERHARVVYEAVTGVHLVDAGPSAPIDFVSEDGTHIVEATQLTSEPIRQLSAVPPLKSLRLSYDWLITLDSPTLGPPSTQRPIPNLRKIGKDLVPLLAQCEDLGIEDPRRFRPAVTAAGEYKEAEPQGSIMRLLGRQRTISCRRFPAGSGTGSVRLVSVYGGFALSDPDDFAAALSSLLASNRTLIEHVDKVKRQDALHRVLFLVPDSSWPPAWNLNSDDGFDALPTQQLDTLGGIDLWIVALDSTYVWIHNATGWQQRVLAAKVDVPA